MVADRRPDRVLALDVPFVETEFGTDQEIYVADAAGGGVRNLTDDDEEAGRGRADMRDEAPSWSPDGRRIAFISTRGEPNGASGWPNTSQVWEMRPDGTALRKRTDTPSYKYSTDWRAVEYLGGVIAPRCFDLETSVTRDTAETIALDCTDDNGDRLTFRIVDPPAHGTLGPLSDGGTVRYTPADGYTGPDEFTYAASDAGESSAVARVRLTVAEPPPPPPPPPPPYTGGGGVVSGGGSGGGGGSHHSGDDEHGPVITIPGDCTVDPRTNSCIVVIPCQPGGDISGCTGNFAQAPAGRRATASALALKTKAPRLLRSVKFRIPAGQSRKVKMRLTAAGRAQLRHKPKMVIRVRVTVRAGGKVIDQHTEKLVFRTRK